MHLNQVTKYQITCQFTHTDAILISSNIIKNFQILYNLISSTLSPYLGFFFFLSIFYLLITVTFCYSVLLVTVFLCVWKRLGASIVSLFCSLLGERFLRCNYYLIKSIFVLNLNNKVNIIFRHPMVRSDWITCSVRHYKFVNITHRGLFYAA